MNLLLLTPVEIAHTVLPEMTARGTGGFIVTGGFTAADPGPFISGIGPATRVVTPPARIKNNEAYNVISPKQLAEITGGTTGMHVIDPVGLAETYWRLYTDHNQIESRFPEPDAADPSTTQPTQDKGMAFGNLATRGSGTTIGIAGGLLR